MARKAKQASGTKTNGNTANLGFEAKLWATADALRNNMDAAEYKHVVLGLIFLKYISDAFEAKHAELESQRKQGAEPEDPDEYRAVSIFWVPPEARWAYLKSMAPQPTIGRLVDDGLASSSIWSATLCSAVQPIAPRIRSAASMNISCHVSPAPRARAAASSIRRPTSSAFWSRYWRPTRAAYTTRAAAPAACSCRARNSSRRACFQDAYSPARGR